MSSEPAFEVPDDRHYDREHNIWAHRDESARVRIGIDTIGLSSLGELAYIALTDPGAAVARGHSLGTLEAAKMTTTIASPVTGIITAVNQAVLEDPQLVNREPYTGGWLIEIDATDWDAEAEHLVSGAAIPAWVEEAVKRRTDESEQNE